MNILLIIIKIFHNNKAIFTLFKILCFVEKTNVPMIIVRKFLNILGQVYDSCYLFTQMEILFSFLFCFCLVPSMWKILSL